MATKYVYSFGGGKAEGRESQRDLLGGKGAGLAEMSRIGLPVPPGFTIAVPACEYFHKHREKWPPELEKQVRTALAQLEKRCGQRLGDADHPLLVSVRSGAARSMPGMMETILNLGLNDESVHGLARAAGDGRFAWDCYRRFLQMYSSVVCGLSKDVLEERLYACKQRAGVESDAEIPAEHLERLCGEFKQVFREETGRDFPQDPWQQLVGAINAVFHSWNAEKAVTYRRVEKITDLKGTAVNVQQMVFGNLGDDSGTGVCFTRDPSTGDNEFYGEMLINAQGEDVVAGIRTPLPLSELKRVMPEVYEQLQAVRVMLEVHYGDMQDLEFTVQRGRLYMLQTRTGKRTPAAAFRIAVEQATKPLLSKAEARRLVQHGYLPKRYLQRATRPVIDRDRAITRISGEDVERLFYPIISPRVPADELRRRRLASGINAVPGAATGRVVFTAREAEEMAERAEAVILVRKETSPEDVGGMQAARGILTQTGGKTSHAAVVARGWGKCCIVGCSALSIDYNAKRMSVNGHVIRQGDYITLDGSTGSVYAGQLELVRPDPPPEFHTLMRWVDRRRRLRVRANADTPEDARRALELGAEGIGLCRTEHMFFATPERRLAIQEMIVAEHTPDRIRALDRLLPYQSADFIGIFEVMAGRPVTIRLIDPPLHEFVPRTREQAEELSRATGIPVKRIMQRIEWLHEANPMMGHRGCRLCITYPEILDMQVRAVMQAAVDVAKRGIRVHPEIMIPLTIDARELDILVQRVREVADPIVRGAGVRIRYHVGTMIETPRAALTADRMARVADFFSFGTNDLTQLTMALSRDDAGRFLPEYIELQRAGIFTQDPFQSIDREGVGALVEHATRAGRAANPDLKVGICGEHGGDPDSVKFCHRIGMDYVSCSPLRVPVARLAAAQAEIEHPTRRGQRMARSGLGRDHSSGRSAGRKRH